MKKLPFLACTLSTLLVASIQPTYADVTLAPVFTDNMVLQRQTKIPVWGKANPHELVTVNLAQQKRSIKADDGGRWKVWLAPVAVAQDLRMVVKGDNEIVLKNIAVGDVYLCSGQSNMSFELQNAKNAQTEIEAANFPLIRLFKVPPTGAAAPKDSFVLPTSWQSCTPESARYFSAVSYFFGRELFQKLNVPIGLIDSSLGATVAQSWTSRATLEARGESKAGLKMLDEIYVNGQANFPTVLFNGMIAPLIPYAFRGVIWYQGESDADNAKQYQTQFPDLIRDWRARWNENGAKRDTFFYFVQLANYYRARTEEPGQPGWPDLREAQAMALSLPRTGMATTIDIGDAGDLHPTNKQDVGKRLALNALALDYGEKTEYSGPIFHKLEIVSGSNQVKIHFTHVRGLKTSDGKEPRTFVVQDQNGKWHDAQASIVGESVILWSDRVLHPQAVAYAWKDNPDVNLVNAAGLPAVPFRTDAH
jgi:sialate O-acetylesterase